MARPKLIFVKIVGTSINERFQALSHEIQPFPANTYHVFVMPNGARLFFNDFGVRTVTIADRLEDLD